MRYILHLRLDEFYVRQGLTQDPGQAVVVVRDKRVLDSNAAARARGVTLSMGQSEAKVLLRGSVFVAWEPGRFTPAQETWLDVAADYTSVLEPDDQHSAFLDLTAHPDPLLVALMAVDAIEGLGYSVRWCLAPVKWMAALGSSMGAKAEPARDPIGFLRPLPVALLPVSPGAIERLRAFGYVTVGQVSGLSVETLQEQFGDEGARVHQLVRGGGGEPVLALHPKDSLADQEYFESLVDDSQVIQATLKIMAERLGKRLREKDLSGQDVHVCLDTEGGVKTLRRRFSKPIDAVRSAYAALSLVLQRLNEPVSGVRVTLPHLTKAQWRQNSISGRADARDLGASAAINAIRGVFGDTAIQKASDVAVPRRDRLMREWKNATGWR